MPDLSSISASIYSGYLITIYDGLKIDAIVDRSSRIKSLFLHGTDPKDVPNIAKGLVFQISCTGNMPKIGNRLIRHFFNLSKEGSLTGSKNALNLSKYFMTLLVFFTKK